MRWDSLAGFTDSSSAGFPENAYRCVEHRIEVQP